MSVAFLNDATITDFVNDEEIFDLCVRQQFKKLDRDGDGRLSEEELRVGLRIPPLAFEAMESEETADDFFDVVNRAFDLPRIGSIGQEEFNCLMKEILLAFADGIGNFLIQVALEEDGLLMKHEKAKGQN